MATRVPRRGVARHISAAETFGRKIVSGELKPGSIVLVDTDGAEKDAQFTFVGTPKATVPDVPVVEAAVAGGPGPVDPADGAPAAAAE